MNRLFVLALIALLLGVGVIALVETEPGYLLIAYRDITIESSLWVGLLLIAVIVLTLYGLVRFLHGLLATPGSLLSWRSGRKSRQAARLTSRGMINFTEGNWAAARKQLLRGARHSDAPVINYLMAARASHQLGDASAAQEYLGTAEVREPLSATAVELTQAELQLQAGQFDKALATLQQATRHPGQHPQVLRLLCRIQAGRHDWEALRDLLPDLRRHNILPDRELSSLQREVYVRLLEGAAMTDDTGSAEELRATWQEVPRALREEEAMLHRYVELLISRSATEEANRLIIKALKRRWDPILVGQFGRMETDNPQRQLAVAEGWLKRHGQDPDLLLCLGRLAARLEQWPRALEFFEQSHKLRPSEEACAELGRLFAARGETERSLAYFCEGLDLQATPLPSLPLPEKSVPTSHRISSSDE